MSLDQYRLKAVAQNRRHLWLCLATAGLLHAGAIALTQPLISSVSAPLQFTAPDLIAIQPDPPNIPANSISRPVEITYQVGSTSIRMNQPGASFPTARTKTPPPVSSTLKSTAAKDDVWDAYLATLRQQIYQQWQASLFVKTDRPTKVRFRVDRQGHLTGLELLQSSRDMTADRNAIRAVQTAAPFAQLPIASQEEQLQVTFTFEDPVFH